MRPATPGFLVTLLATILLAVVSFSVPWFKSIFFLKASLSVEGIDGTITFGVLGYCLELSNGTTCSKPSVGYELDINQLVGNRTRIQIPTVIVKWITYALFLHIIALAFATAASVFGLLAHVREFSMTCFSTCTSGVGAAITLLAFVFDIAFFFIAKSRLNSVQGGSATMGNAIWLTLAAWVLLFFSGCFYGLGRCCIRRRPRDMAPSDGGRWVPSQPTGPTYEEQMRLDAVKAEADRKARQKQGELGLPSFPEYDPTQPLTSDNENDSQPHAPYRDRQYAAAPVGTRAVDEYYNNTAGSSAYPPRRQPTNSSARTQQTGYAPSQQTSGYASSTYTRTTTVEQPPPVPSGYLNADHARSQTEPASRYASNVGYGHSQYGNGNGDDYGAYNAPARGATDISDVDPFQAYTTPQSQPPFNPTTYNTTAGLPPPLQSSRQPYVSPAAEPNSSYYTPTSSVLSSQTRSNTLGGGGYGGNTVPAAQDPRSSANSAGYLPYPGSGPITPSSGSIYTGMDSPTSPRGPRDARLPSPSPYEDSPPTYDEGIGAGAGHRPPVASGKR